MINRAISRLNIADVCAALAAGTHDGVFLCEATETQWREFVRSETQTLKSRGMEWRPIEDDPGSAELGSQQAMERRGRVFIVEPSSGLHESLVHRVAIAIAGAAATWDEHLAGDKSTFLEGDFHEPDLGFSPDDRIGASKPGHFRWNEFHTLKVEVGVYRSWSSLERQAHHWATVDCVEYVLLIRVAPGMETREYTLYAVIRPAEREPTLAVVGQPRASIQLPPASTRIHLSARRLLALPDAVEMPLGFCGGRSNLEIDLSTVVERAIARVSY